MHLVFATRGKQKVVEELIECMNSAAYRLPVINKGMCKCIHKKGMHFGADGECKTCECKKFDPIEVRDDKVVQGVVRPIQLWEYIFPEQHLDTVLKGLNLPRNGNFQAKEKLLSLPIRKTLGLKKIPKHDPKKARDVIFWNKDKVHLWGIGIKEDVKGAIDFTNGKTGETVVKGAEQERI